ncbi:response regulator transcription factor [Ideonella sp. 4Y16]|uniref:Response regulator transcription factor n=1 Tax=Ideonella aquatica TaxID=2824119 RepID=A0A940YHM7_9BURK|nr:MULTISPECIES: LytTR family DNA-binding domain-containing protein [Ideonella]MBQ0946168.1 response regulator transcription factor [Ideonella alba]MBQ0960408.1 response regulator transcription factor [Ideonella aquatica]
MNQFPVVKVLIAEDDPDQRRQMVEAVLHLRPQWQVVAEAADANEVLAGIDALAPDLLILDIHLPGSEDGKWVEQIPASAAVIFVTGDPAFAVQAFDKDAIDYLLKPVSRWRLKTAIERAERDPRMPVRTTLAVVDHDDDRSERAEDARSQSQWITASKGNDVIVVPEWEVIYLQADLKYTRVVSTRGDGLVRMGLNELAARHGRQYFVKIHRSIILNLRFVQSVRRNELGYLDVYLFGRSEVLKVSKTYQGVFKSL